MFDTKTQEKIYAGALDVIWRRGIHRQKGDKATAPPPENEGASIPPEIIKQPKRTKS